METSNIEYNPCQVALTHSCEMDAVEISKSKAGYIIGTIIAIIILLFVLGASICIYLNHTRVSDFEKENFPLVESSDDGEYSRPMGSHASPILPERDFSPSFKIRVPTRSLTPESEPSLSPRTLHIRLPILNPPLTPDLDFREDPVVGNSTNAKGVKSPYNVTSVPKYGFTDLDSDDSDLDLAHVDSYRA